MQADHNSQWFALIVTARHEKKVEHLLAAKGHETFVPLHTRIRHWSGRRRVVELPMISGYIFCRFNAEYKLPILTTPGVHTVISFGGGPAPVDEQELESLRKAATARLACQPWPYMKEGQKVCLVAGPLKGVTGHVISIGKHYKLVLSVTLLQRSVMVEVDAAWVEHTEFHPTNEAVLSSGIGNRAVLV